MNRDFSSDLPRASIYEQCNSIRQYSIRLYLEGLAGSVTQNTKRNVIFEKVGDRNCAETRNVIIYSVRLHLKPHLGFPVVR